MKKIIFAFAALFFISVASHAQDSSNAMKMDTSYADYIGTYNFPDGSAVSEVEIGWQDTSLVISSDQGTATLSKLGVDSFSMSYADGAIAFKRGDDNKVKMIDIYVMGMTLEGTKALPIGAGTAWVKDIYFDDRKTSAEPH